MIPQGPFPHWQLWDGTVGWWNSTSQIVERVGTVRPAVLWIVLLQCYSQSHHPAFCWQLERPQRPIPVASPIDSFRDGTVEWWNSTSQIMEQPGIMRSAVLWIALLQRYSQSHRPAFCQWLARPQRTIPAAGPIDGCRDGMVEWWNSTRQNRGTAGNREAGGFVNSAVNVPLWP